ncbi:hypothetical protein B0H10DRAFT_1954439 [Mycena sp. CBHHK59/15]|nr:hypothetical protein B0H10DRAFT_1954439 [Mycena sp. CBHHK59/15]
MQKAPNTLLALETMTALKHGLMLALKDVNAKNKVQKLQMIAMHSALVLNGTYCDLAQGQLATQEKHKNHHRKGHLIRDGLPCLLASRTFMHRVIKFEEAAMEKVAALEERKAMHVKKAEILKTWKALDAD